MRWLLIVLSILMSYRAYTQDTYNIVMYTDADAKVRAEEFKQYLMQKPPYNRLGDKVKVTIVELSAEVMDCKNDNPSSPRIINCNRDELLKLKAKDKAHLALAFTSKGAGGSGGVIPVASNDYPIQTMFHEMLHAYGFGDEYDYSDSERSVYCKMMTLTPNIIYFKDVPPYADDASARVRHQKDVPWMGKITSEQLITTDTNLGSPDVAQKNGEQSLGLYRGGSCNASDYPGWRPYRNSIMKGYVDDTIYPIYEEAILRSIESSMGKKFAKDAEIPSPPAPCLQHNHEEEMLKGYEQEMKEITKHI